MRRKSASCGVGERGLGGGSRRVHQHVQRPFLLHLSAEGVPGSLVRDVEWHEGCPIAQVVGDRLAAVEIDVTENHASLATMEQPCRRCSDAAGSAGDQRRPPAECAVVVSHRRYLLVRILPVSSLALVIGHLGDGLAQVLDRSSVGTGQRFRKSDSQYA